MLEKVTENTARNIANGILLQVCDLQNMDKTKPKKDKVIKQQGPPKKEKTEPTQKYFTMFAAEVLGTGLLMYLGCMGSIPEIDNPPTLRHMSSISFGLVVLLIIQLIGHISGAHLNPAVTLAAVINKLISPMMGVVYVAAQFIGAIAGFALLKVSIPSEYVKPGFCLTLPHERMTTLQALTLETIITTVLIIVVCSVWDKRNATKQDSMALKFGFIIAAISMVAGPFTGASMNTVRTFAPAVLEANFDFQWIYWVGPTMGAILGCGIYKFLFAAPEDEDEKHYEETYRLDDITLEKS